MCSKLFLPLSVLGSDDQTPKKERPDSDRSNRLDRKTDTVKWGEQKQKAPTKRKGALPNEGEFAERMSEFTAVMLLFFFFL